MVKKILFIGNKIQNFNNNRTCYQVILKHTLFLLIFILAAGISRSQIPQKLKLFSSAFEDGKPIPAKYTCDSTNISPPLSWTGVPEKTQSYAIIMDDPDAPMMNWVHWIIYNIPGTITSLTDKNNAAQINALEGLNSWFEKGYNGPCPPDGTHQYVFKLYALDKILPVKEGLTKDELLEVMKAHVIGDAVLTGLFRN